MFTCSVTGKKFKTARGAKKSEARHRLALERKNFFRLNAESPRHLFELISTKSKEFWGWDFHLLELKTGDPGRSEDISSQSRPDTGVYIVASFEFNPNRKHRKHQSVWEYINTYINGLDCHSSWWWGETLNKRKYIDQKIWLSFKDFPIFNSKYNDYMNQLNEYYSWCSEERIVDKEARLLVRDFDSIKIIKEQIEDLDKKRDLASRLLEDKMEYHINKYKTLLWLPHNPKPLKPTLFQDHLE